MTKNVSIICLGEWQRQDFVNLENKKDNNFSYFSLPASFDGGNCQVERSNVIFSVLNEQKYEDLTISHMLNELSVIELPCLLASCPGSPIVAQPLTLKSDIRVNESEMDNRLAEAMRSYEDGDYKQALSLFESVLALKPSHKPSLFNMASILQMLGYGILSLHYIERLLLEDPTDMTAHSFLWAIYTSGVCKDKFIIDVYEKLVEKRGDVQAMTRLAVLTGKGSAATTSNTQYVAHVFDNMASCFEEKLTMHLQYDAPWVLHRLIAALHPPTGNWRILDLGCGSGLCAKVFIDYYTKPALPHKYEEHTLVKTSHSQESMIIGVDISSKMVEIARKLELYDTVECVDLATTLSYFQPTIDSEIPPTPLDMIIAADTFVYVGALGQIFHLVYNALKPNGLFAFSTEDLEASPMLMKPISDEYTQQCASLAVVQDFELVDAVPGWGAQLLSSARFGHSNHYISKLCEIYSFEIVALERKPLRYELGTPLSGNMFVLRKN